MFFIFKEAMKRLLTIFLAALFIPSVASAMILVRIPGVKGDANIPGYNDGNWFVADSFAFGVERELRESGEKGGTEDINIGLGELQLCTISRGLDRASARLMQLAINGNATATADIHFLQFSQGNPPVVYLAYKLDRCFIKSWSTSGDADDRPTEEVAFYYNKIAFRYYHTTDGIKFTDGGVMSWDLVASKPWSGHNLPTTPPNP